LGRFAVIGLGNFGTYAAKVLHELGHDVIVMDTDEVLVKAAQNFSTYGLVGSATDQKLIASLQVKNLDAVFVTMGSQISDSILVTLHLVDLKAKRIIAKITSEDHGRVLMKVGAHEVVFPERDMATQVANYVSSPTIMNYLDLDPEYSILEVAPHQDFIGKTLAETKLRHDYGVNVIGIKDVLMDKISINPGPSYIIKDSDSLIVIGHRQDLTKLSRKSEKG
jgi:trk system potassium uptake protein TrkA